MSLSAKASALNLPVKITTCPSIRELNQDSSGELKGKDKQNWTVVSNVSEFKGTSTLPLTFLAICNYNGVTVHTKIDSSIYDIKSCYFNKKDETNCKESDPTKCVLYCNKKGAVLDN